MRTAKPLEDIGIQFNLSKSTVCDRISKIRKILMVDFVPQNLTNELSREDLLSHTTTMSRSLFAPPEEAKALVICDGTYIYVDKSKNYEFQRNTYTDQKKRNFLKFMMIISCDGYIVHALGPYKARDNDAKILEHIHRATNKLDNLQPGDILMLDRGFRDCVKYFEEKNFEVKTPSLLQLSKQKGQLTTIEANKTRLVTATRFVVEVRNGHLKKKLKIFDTVWNLAAVPLLADDVSICCALINRFTRCFEPNENFANEIAQRMLERVNLPNELTKIVTKRNFQTNYNKFQTFEEFESLPQLNEEDLIRISLGTYQIKLAPSYACDHIKGNNGKFVVYRFENEWIPTFFEKFITVDNSLVLLMTRTPSRFSNRKSHDAFILIDKNSENLNVVLEYCCSCYCGLRTVGCCSHVMCLIWFTLFAKNQNFKNPAGFLDKYFDTVTVNP